MFLHIPAWIHFVIIYGCLAFFFWAGLVKGAKDDPETKDYDEPLSKKNKRRKK